MKRSAALQSLSRDHHHALEAARRLRRARDGAAAATALAHFSDFWRRHGAEHFIIEERVLLPPLDAEGAESEAAARRVREEHADIRARVAAVENDDRPLRDVQALGEALHAHVRFEERELFPLLERRFDAARLAQLGKDVERASADATD